MALYMNGVKVGGVHAASTPEVGKNVPLAPSETGSVGTSTAYSREDHQHPSDTTKQDKITVGGGC